MKIFVAGGTGVLGKRLVPKLLKSNHEVRVLSRTKENENMITHMGAIPVNTSIFNRDDLVKKTEDIECFLHLATSIPKKNKTSPQDWDLNEKIRIEGTRNLVEAAKQADCKLYVQQSATFGYGHKGEELLDEQAELQIPTPTAVNIGSAYRQILDDIKRMEDIVNTAHEHYDLPTIILRFGWFYSHDSTNIQNMIEGNFAHVFRTDPYISIISVDDAVSAIQAVVTNYQGNTGETFNVVDNSDATWREFINHGTQLAGSGNPMVVPAFMVKLMFSSYALNFLKTSTRVDNEKIKKKLGWTPEYPTYKEGLPREIDLYRKQSE